jgi:hypothetical protein
LLLATAGCAIFALLSDRLLSAVWLKDHSEGHDIISRPMEANAGTWDVDRRDQGE